MKRKISVIEALKSLVQELLIAGRIGTAHVYHSTLNRILHFNGSKPLYFEQITPLWLSAFQNYLIGRQLHWNSISTYMRMLRAVYLRAVDRGECSYKPRLFKGVYTGTRSTVKRAISVDELKKLSVPHPEVKAELNKTRMLFLLLFMLRGIPFVDLVYLRKCDLKDGVICYRRRKTGTWISVRLDAAAVPLLEALRTQDDRSPYLFPFITPEGVNPYAQYQKALRRFNFHLKKLSALIGCTPLSSYSARHSWATTANFCNFHQELISNAMGHSSVRVTETYFKHYSDEAIDKMNRSVISLVMWEI